VASSACDHPPAGRPLIGLTTYLEPTPYRIWDLDAALLPAVYVNAVTQAGGRLVLLPPGRDLRLFAALIDIASERRSARRSAAQPKESTCPLPTM
jgi:hypothetical protein